MKIAVILGAIVVLGGIAFYVLKRPAQVPISYAPIESKVALNDAQLKEVPKEKSPGVPVYRFKSAKGSYQVSVGSASVQPAQLIGNLYPAPVAGEVDAAVYLCSYPGFAGDNESLDLTSNCTGEGKLLKKEPVGYVSKVVRTGFRLWVRCRSEAAGFYPTLNVNCEDPKDRVHGMLGSIRAAE